MSAAPGRILHLLAEDIVGGTEILVALVAERMARRGLPVEVATFFPPGPVAQRLKAQGIPVWSLGGDGVANAARRLTGLLRHRRYEVVEGYGFKMSLAARVVARAVQPEALVVTGVMGMHITEVVELDEPKGKVALAVERLTTGLVDAYEVNSRGAIELLARNGVSRDRMRYIPNAIDSAFWGQAPATPRPSTGERRIVCNARFVERKRQMDLIEALPALVRRGLAVRLVLAGDGPTRTECERRAAELDLEGAVEFAGAMDQRALRELLQGSDVFALVSTWEGMPAAVIEAMAAGLPVVGSDVNGIADLVDDGVTGRLVPPRDPERLAAVLSEMLEAPEELRRMGRAARAAVARDYDLEVMIDRKLALYALAAEARRRSP